MAWAENRPGDLVFASKGFCFFGVGYCCTFPRTAFKSYWLFIAGYKPACVSRHWMAATPESPAKYSLKNSMDGIFHCRKTKAWFCFAHEFNGLLQLWSVAPYRCGRARSRASKTLAFTHRIRRHFHVPQGSSDLIRASLSDFPAGGVDESGFAAVNSYGADS